MGTQKVNLLEDISDRHKFTKALLTDVRSLEYILENDWIESGITRFGAEVEMVVVDRDTLKPKNIAMSIMDQMNHPKWLDGELAQFNLEFNLQPREFKGSNFSLMEKEIHTYLKKLETTLKKNNATYVLTGILPTLQKFNLDIENLTPRKRYFALMDAIKNLGLGKDVELKLFGIDNLYVRHDTPLLEAANTSFQVHLQVDAPDYVQMYNLAQMLAGPSTAVAANSPIMFGKRLWHETRIANFEQSLDTRVTNNHMREQSTRVSFGRSWINESILEIYKEDIARFKVLLSSEIENNSWEQIQKGKAPDLDALLVHNSTVYRWNRPQYGISPNGKPHLRIENRVMPAGPSVPDMVANAVFWLGAMKGMALKYKDIRKVIDYSTLRDNFGRSARVGLSAEYTWIKGKKIGVRDLILKELIPVAREGLKSCKVNSTDINNYLGIIKDRVKKKTNGAIWMLDSYSHLLKQDVSQDETLSTLTHAIIMNQRENLPVHKWKKADLSDLRDYKPFQLKVAEFMQTDLFTCERNDIIQLVGEMMDWKKIRYVPVEDSEGNLEGLVTARLVTRHLLRQAETVQKTTTVEDIMIHKPKTIDADDNIIQAMKLMRKAGCGALPVVKNKLLVGMITETDFLDITSRLLERLHIDE
jgi:CBS domain-containing protein/gamma-glutamylcysteine synthetase